MKRRIGFIGCGNLGRALLRGWLDAGVVRPAEVSVAARTSAMETASIFGVEALKVTEVVDQSDLIILAVKPQQVASVLGGLTFKEGQTLVSVMAGVDMRTLQNYAPQAHIIRTMPNVASGIGKGTTVGGAMPGVPSDELSFVEELFRSVGVFSWVEDEDIFHLATALVGSGPAFVFLMMQALIDAAEEHGVARGTARDSVIAMVQGAAILAGNQDDSLQALKDSVTSPGGTTAAGLKTLENRGFRAALIDAVGASAVRSRELAKEATKQ